MAGAGKRAGKSEARKPSKEIFTIASDERITIAGMTGTGKTCLARFILRKFSKVLVWDPLGQYEEFNAYHPDKGTKEEFDYVCQQVWDKGNILFCVEEAEGALHEGKDFSEYAYKVIHQGRNRGIGVMAVTRRIADLSKTMFGLSQHVYIFRFFSPNDIDYIKGFVGKEWAERIRNLPQFHFIYYGGGNNICECEPIEL